MAADARSLLRLEVPLIVRIGGRPMSLEEVLGLAPGSLIELPTGPEEDLEIVVNNKPIALGRALKVGENFGVRLTFVGDVVTRLGALDGAGGLRATAAAPLKK